VADDRGGRARAFPVALWSAFAENHPASKVIHRVVLMVAVEASRMSKPLHRLQSAAERTTSWGRPMDQYKPGDACGPLGRLIDVIAAASDAGWGQTARIGLLLIVGSAAAALVITAGMGHW